MDLTAKVSKVKPKFMKEGSYNIKQGEKLGRGMDKEVYIDPENLERVFKFFTNEPAKEKFRSHVKARFYFHKILHLIFPKMVPDIYFSSSEPNMLKMQRINLDERHVAIQRASEYYFNNQKPPEDVVAKEKRASRDIITDPGWKDFRDAMEALDIESDLNAINFSSDEQGNLVYLDDFDPWIISEYGDHIENSFNMDKLKAKIETLDREKRENASSFLYRLEELRKEANDEFKHGEVK